MVFSTLNSVGIKMGLLRGHFIILFISLAQWVSNVTSQDLGIVGCPILPVRLAVEMRTDLVVGTWTESTTFNSDVMLIDRSHIPGEAMFPVGFTDVVYTFRDTVTGDEDTCEFTFIVFWIGDDQPPQIQGCPEDITRTTSSSASTVSVSWSIPTAIDNAGPVRLQTNTHDPPFDFSFGTTPVMYTFEDTRGLEATCEFNVNIVEEDVQGPVIACPGDQSVQAPVGATQAVVRWSAVTATDNVGTPTLISMTPQTALFGLTGGTFSIGTTNVGYTYSDSVGNIATCTFNVEVRVGVDMDPPVVNCPEEGPPVFTVASGDNGQAFWPVPMVISDDSMPVLTMSNFDPGHRFPIGSTRVEYRFIDRVGNEARCAFNVVVQDTTPPIFNNCPQRDITADISIGQVTVAVSWATITAIDNSGIQPSVIGTHQSGDQFQQGSTMVSFTAEDRAGNQATCNFNVVATPVNDPQPPVITGCPSTITMVAPSDQQGAVVGWTEPTAEADLGVPARDRSHVPPTFFPIGRTDVEYTFTDLAGNFATCMFDVIVLDQTPPDISNCPSSPIRASLLPPQTMTVVTFTPLIATDNSQGVITDDCTHNSGDVFPEGPTLVTCEFTDESGNSNVCMFQVIVGVTDPVSPVIMNCPSDITRQATGPEPVIVQWPPLIVTDNSGIQPTRLLGPPDFQDSFSPGTSEIVIYIYSDAANNNAECMFTVTIVPPSAPMVDCSGVDITVTAPFNQPCVNVDLRSCSATSSAGTVTQVSQSPPSGSCFSVGITTVTNVFQDSNGLQGSGTFTVTVNPSVDIIPPVVDCSDEDFSVSAPEGSSGLIVATLPRCTATDNSGRVNFFSQTPSPGSFFTIGPNQVTVVYQDPSGNSGSDSFTITVIPTVPSDPDILCPVASTPVDNNVFVWSNPDCTGGQGSLSTNCIPPSGSTFGLGTTTVSCSCTDSRGRSSSCSFVVEVNDIEPPMVDCSGDDVTATAPAGASGVPLPTLPRCRATDNSGQVDFVTQNPSPGSFFPIGDTMVTVVYRDPAGNTGVGFFTVRVQPGTLPITIVCPNDEQPLSEIRFDTLIWSDPTCTGGVRPLSTGCNPPSGSTFDIGTSIVTCFCTDTSGLSDTCSFPVTVADVISPLVDCSGEGIRITAQVGASGATVPNLPRCRATDNSGQVDFVSQNPSPGSFFPVGDTRVTVVYRDPSGNTGVGSFIVTVQPGIADVAITCPVDGAGVRQVGTGDLIGVWSEPVCTGGVPPHSTSCTPRVGSNIAIGDTQVVCTCTDSRGESDGCGFIISVEDTVPPVVDCNGIDVTQRVPCGTTSVPVTLPTCTATDNSNTAQMVSQSPPSGSLFDVGTTLVTNVFVDLFGNTGTGTFVVNVIEDDCEDPVVDCSDINIIRTVPFGTTEVIVTFPLCTATDNSGIVIPLPQSPPSGSPFPVGTTTVINIFEDPSGNRGVGIFTVTIMEDAAPPEISCPRDARVITQGSRVIAVWSEPFCELGSGSLNVRCNPPSGSVINVGQMIVTCTCIDSRGAEDMCVFAVDSQPPEVDCSGLNIVRTVPFGTPCVIVTLPTCRATDNSGTVTPLPQSPPSTFCFPVGTNTVMNTFQDPSGNEGTGTFTVTIVVVDSQPPEVDCSGLNVVRTVPFGTPCVIVTLPTCTATDNSGTVTPLPQSPPSTFCFPVGTNTVMNTFQDPSGNEETGTFTVTIVVVDSQPPEVDCSGLNIVRTIPFGTPCVIVTLPTCTATDNSGTVTPLPQSPPSTFCFPVGTNTVMNTFQDPSGNEETGTFTVTIVVDVPVVISCPTPSSVPVGSPGTFISVWSDPTCMGGRDPLSIRCDRQSGLVIPIGVTTVTCTCTDSRGEEDTCSFDLVGVDVSPPEVDCSGLNIVRTLPFGTPCVIVTLPTCRATDNSGTVTPLPQSPPSTFCFPVGTNTVMNTFQDPSGNEETGTFTVTIIQDRPVMISCPTDGRSETQGNLDTAIGVWSDATCTGGRNPLDIRCDRQSGNVIPLGITRVTCTCTDSRGEEDTCSFTVEVVDTTPPTIIRCPDDIVIQALITRGGDIISYDAPVAFDASGSVEVVNDPVFVPGSYFPIGTTSVTYIFADSSNNRASCTFDVTVIGANPCDNSRCLNGGVCIALTLTDSTCVCTGCFTGPSCQISAGPCVFNRCENGGTCQPLQGSCQASFCNCPPCFTGLTCQRRVGACRNHECQNGAVCIPASSDCDQYTCQCPSCFLGDFCQTAIPDPCDSSPCLNGGQCSRVPNSCYDFTCTCNIGFSGERCEQVVNVLDNPCNNFPCLNQGSCISFGSTYKCICRPGFLGRNCQQTVGGALSFEGCSPISPCQNGGTCFESYTSTSGLNPRFSQYICICNSGFTGQRCAIPVNQAPQLNRCLGTNICQNGGTCRNSYCSFQDRIDFFCECPIGFIGEVCSIPYGNPCSTRPCGDGGVCQPFNQYFVCSCLPGYSGITCDQIRDTTPPTVSGCPQEPIVVTAPLGSNTAVVSWSEPTASDNSGQTVHLVSVNASPGARYPVGTHQVLYIFEDAAGNQNTCSFSVTVVRATDACNPNPCQNGGNCRIINGRFSCVCPSGFTGQTCTQATDACNPNPCQNGGNCRIINGRFSCVCPSGFTGQTCTQATDACNPNPCQNGGNCRIINGRFSCVCPSGFSGQTCTQVMSDNPCDSSPCLNGGTCVMLTSEVFVCLCDRSFNGPRCENVVGDACSTRPCQNGGTCVPVNTDEFVCICNIGFQGLRCQSGFGGVDVTPPDISDCPGNTTVSFSPGVMFLSVSWTAPTAEDESPPIRQEQNRRSPAFLEREQTLNVIYEFTDRLGNTATCSFFFFSDV